MYHARDRQDAGPSLTSVHPEPLAAAGAALWRADQLGSPVAAVLSSGFEPLDAQLPGGGWPCHGLTEILMPQDGTLEWRLLGPALRQVCEARRPVVLVGPPHPPHPLGLRCEGIEERHLVWVRAETPPQRLWSVEQLVKANACGALVAWLPQARAEQIRRLQVLAAACEGPVFLCRPLEAARTSSAAPLRMRVGVEPDWALCVDIFKRKGPPLPAPLRLASVPGGLRSILTPRLSHPGQLLSREGGHAVVGASAPRYRGFFSAPH